MRMSADERADMKSTSAYLLSKRSQWADLSTRVDVVTHTSPFMRCGARV